MKTALIVYFSQGGTTAKVATAISKGLKDRGYHTDLFSITDDASPNVAEYASGKDDDKPPEDPLPPAVYTLERMLTIRPLLNYFYSYFYKVDSSRCNSCGLCVKLCPQKNVNLDQKERPRWDRNCLFCGYCEMRCRKMVHRMVFESRFQFGTNWTRDEVSLTKNNTRPSH